MINFTRRVTVSELVNYVLSKNNKPPLTKAQVAALMELGLINVGKLGERAFEQLEKIKLHEYSNEPHNDGFTPKGETAEIKTSLLFFDNTTGKWAWRFRSMKGKNALWLLGMVIDEITDVVYVTKEYWYKFNNVSCIGGHFVGDTWLHLSAAHAKSHNKLLRQLLKEELV